MKITKIIATATAMAAAVSLISAASAQLGSGPAAPGGFGGAKGAQIQRAKIWEELNLTDQQKADIKAIREKYRPQLQEVRNSNLSPEEKKAKAKEIGKAMHSEVASVLTPEQREKLEAYKKEHPRGVKKERKWDALNLTDQQKAQIKEITQSYKPRFEEVRNSSMTQDEKRAKMKELSQAMRSEIMALLTDEQKEKFSTLKRGPGRAKGQGGTGFRPGQAPGI